MNVNHTAGSPFGPYNQESIVPFAVMPIGGATGERWTPTT